MDENGIEVREYSSVSTDVGLLASNELDSTSAVNGSQADGVGNGMAERELDDIDLIWIDSASCCYALYSKLNSEKIHLQQSPLALPKAVKVNQSSSYQSDVPQTYRVVVSKGLILKFETLAVVDCRPLLSSQYFGATAN